MEGEYLRIEGTSRTFQLYSIEEKKFNMAAFVGSLFQRRMEFHIQPSVDWNWNPVLDTDTPPPLLGLQKHNLL